MFSGVCFCSVPPLQGHNPHLGTPPDVHSLRRRSSFFNASRLSILLPLPPCLSAVSSWVSVLILQWELTLLSTYSVPGTFLVFSVPVYRWDNQPVSTGAGMSSFRAYKATCTGVLYYFVSLFALGGPAAIFDFLVTWDHRSRETDSKCLESSSSLVKAPGIPNPSCEKCPCWPSAVSASSISTFMFDFW